MSSSAERGSTDSPPWWSWLARWLLVTTALIVARWEILDSPPYYDFAIGLWVEADYLAQSGFDVLGLRYREEFSMGRHGGRRSYMTSVMPAVAAGFMRLFASHRTPLVAYHLLVLACGGAALATLVGLWSQRVGRAAAWCLAAAVATTPVFCVQLDMLGFEIPLIAAALAAVAAASQGHWRWATMFSLAAFFVKPTGALIGAAILVFQAAVWIARRQRTAPESATPALVVRPVDVGLQFGALVAQCALMRWAGSVGGQMRSGPPLFMLLFWCPDVLGVGLATGLSGLWLLSRKVRCERTGRRQGRLTSLCAALADHPQAALGALGAAMVLAGISQVVFIPRYVAALVPLVYLVAARPLFPRDGGRVPGWIALAALVSFNLANWNGALFPSLDWVNARVLKTTTIAREGSFLERSHEYLADHRDNQAAVAYLAEHCRDDDIFAGVPFNLALSLPRLGYLRPGQQIDRHGYSNIGFHRITRRWHEAADAVELVPRRPVMVRTDNVFYHHLNHFVIDGPTGDDEILLARSGPSRLVIYRPAEFQKPHSDVQLRAWYAHRLRVDMLADDTKLRLAPWLARHEAADP